MTEFTHGILTASKSIYQNNKGSILRTIIYTIGHFAIAITVLMLIANVSFMIALTDAIVEPLANAVWYFILDKVWTAKYKNRFNINPINFLFNPTFDFFSGYFAPIFLHFLINKSFPFLEIARGLE